ncbi:MAG: tRNA preQ1(34) S-adenosylmethionine ribosyltransferase-isomerase QueA [Candidatus Omnitrophica bacterium]|nr:tRNA preQ1(34) S-adenosylmethionine ribosyltransferase-isomerase QueA [Candidatus Omnitrophota bacterium]
MKLKEFDYKLPKSLIAQEPLQKRDSSRLMVLDRKKKTVQTETFCDIEEYLSPGDCLVLNDTRVLPVRFLGKRKTGGKVEIFVLNPASEKLYALIRPSKRVKDGEKIELGDGIKVLVLEKAPLGRFVRFNMAIEDVLKKGHVPLPPYISRDDTKKDEQNYQTVYAKNDGATAAPTAGLHFTKELIKRLSQKGVSIVYVTLHTGYGTFSPVVETDIENHKMHSEWYEISEEAASVINATKAARGRVFAVGTTSVRVMESAARKKGKIVASKGMTDLYIYPGYDFKIVDAMVTNFHLPKSTLLMLISAFAGKGFVFQAYREAIKRKFRFFSYGDAMMIV